MSSAISPLAPKARAAYSAYATRRDLADELADCLDAMHEYASNRNGTYLWDQAVWHLAHATEAIAFVSVAPRKDRRDRHRIAATVTMSAILAFERAYAMSLSYDEHGRYNPAPGSEYPFSVSDIGRATVQILGSTWHAESLPWGVGAYIEEQGEAQGYTLAVDGDGDLYLGDDARGGDRTYMTDASAADGLDTLAERIADLVLSLHTTTD
ncbi:hypothetical protein [Streptomyces cavernicola]|uniref:Uncharacterized protein n=1 Tax=Streptomyces cavernicola TaxID=3043613 RepID=A0ABT6SN64_9ACTN|nr:hypothetical protein [Streptomyces sp. B-S-A6]MDI3409284.1 hypothetical protein [Streptomyces sp. B-S-A6]